MPRVVVTAEARRELDRLIASRSLPRDTRGRVRGSLAPLGSHPLIGPALNDAGEGYRFVLGPWPWMLLVYRFDVERDTVLVASIQDARAADAATQVR
jgi:plasmid stabilization system protein ParE